VLAGLLAAGLLARRPEAGTALAVLPALLAAQVLVAHPRLWPVPDRSPPRLAHLANMDRLQEMVRATPGPVLSQDMVLLLRAGKEVPLEPAIIRDLARVGVCDETPLAELLRRHGFDFIITNNTQVDPYYTAFINRVIADEYPCIEKLGRYWVRRPARAC
jgi:hypothetical protein